MGTVDVRPAPDRFHTRIGWLAGPHSVSLSGHQDPAENPDPDHPVHFLQMWVARSAAGERVDPPDEPRGAA